MTDWQRIGKQEYRRYLNKNQVIYRGPDNAYQAADGGGWLPGIYADEAAALKALDVIQAHADELSKLAHWEVRGEGDDYRPITMEDLVALERDGT